MIVSNPHQNASTNVQFWSSFSAKYTNDEKVSTETLTSMISKPSSFPVKHNFHVSRFVAFAIQFSFLGDEYLPACLSVQNSDCNPAKWRTSLKTRRILVTRTSRRTWKKQIVIVTSQYSFHTRVLQKVEFGSRSRGRIPNFYYPDFCIKSQLFAQ